MLLDDLTVERAQRDLAEIEALAGSRAWDLVCKWIMSRRQTANDDLCNPSSSKTRLRTSQGKIAMADDIVRNALRDLRRQIEMKIPKGGE